ncbi:phytanoyl-CoA dioxygenase family protein [bacterium]|nr:phytanoyl-CoA dioxygenase family protein [bacterium]
MLCYRELGFHVEYDVWTKGECEELVAASHELPSYRGGSFVPVMHPHRIDARFMKALRKPELVLIMERILGGRASGLQTELFFCRPGTPGFSLHQDNHYVEAKRDAFASAWCALEDTAPGNGGLIAYPRTHKEPVLPVRAVENPAPTEGRQDPNANKMEAVLPPGYERADLTVPRGAVVLLHSHTVHGSHANTSNRSRHVLLSTYLRSGETFRPGRYAKREEVDLHAT